MAHVSEVAQIREQIEREHEAACFALTGPAIGTAQHWFISRRMKRIGDYQARLSALVGEQASMEIVIQVMESSQPKGQPLVLGTMLHVHSKQDNPLHAPSSHDIL